MLMTIVHNRSFQKTSVRIRRDFRHGLTIISLELSHLILRYIYNPNILPPSGH